MEVPEAETTGAITVTPVTPVKPEPLRVMVAPAGKAGLVVALRL